MRCTQWAFPGRDRVLAVGSINLNFRSETVEIHSSTEMVNEGGSIMPKRYFVKRKPALKLPP